MTISLFDPLFEAVGIPEEKRGKFAADLEEILFGELLLDVALKISPETFADYSEKLKSGNREVFASIRALYTDAEWNLLVSEKLAPIIESYAHEVLGIKKESF